MKYIEEFRDGHTHAVFRYGIHDMMPENVHFIHGPGCPVCVLPVSRIDHAIRLVEEHDVILCSYGDLMRVPASGRKSLLKAKAAGEDVRMVYSTQDALRIARENPDRKVIFFAIGFETTTPPTTVAIRQAAAEGLKNFTVFCNHVLTPAAIQNILESPEVRRIGTVPIDGFFGPSHVSAIIGSRPYEFFAEEFQKPVVIAGFEPLDVMQSTLMLIRQINEGRCEVENEYRRVVTREGNSKAQRLVADVFELRHYFEWRGLGLVSYRALRIKSSFAPFDAEKCFAVDVSAAVEVPGCECPAMSQLIEQLFIKCLDNELLRQGNDQAAFDVPAGRMVISTDGHVVSPLFFPGGDIGSLAVHGTINDVAMAASAAGVSVVTGDTKVVEKGKGDGVFITTTSIGIVPAGVNISGDRARPGDVILLSGSIGDHGVAIMSSRENLEFETEICSDSAALHEVVACMVEVAPGFTACAIRPTTLNELALDPLYVANEGRLVCICTSDDADGILAAMKSHPLARKAAIIGTVVADELGFVQMQTAFGDNRMIDWLVGEQLPRIC